MPQTWENPALKSVAGYGGDNDPLDVIEIGSSPLPRGAITPVKVLGSLGMIDDGENDSKVIVLRTSDPLAATIDGLDDMDPSVTARLVDWLKNDDLIAEGVRGGVEASTPTPSTRCRPLRNVRCARRSTRLTTASSPTRSKTPSRRSTSFTGSGRR